MHNTITTSRPPRRIGSGITAIALALALAGCGGGDDHGETIGSLRLIGDYNIKTKTLCLTDAEGANPRLYFATAEKNALCTPPSGTVAGGKIALGNICRADVASGEEERVLRIDGTYGPELYSAKASMKTHAGANDVEIRIDVAGRFDGACKGDEDPRTGTPR